MTQVGLNNGPRHARVCGWAKSFVKTLTSSQMVESDQDIIGTSSLLWSLIQSSLPLEISKHVNDYLDREQLPRIATRNVAEGIILFIFSLIFSDYFYSYLICILIAIGYKILLGDMTYNFPLQERGPPELYMSRGYTVYVLTAFIYFAC